MQIISRHESDVNKAVEGSESWFEVTIPPPEVPLFLQYFMSLEKICKNQGQ